MSHWPLLKEISVMKRNLHLDHPICNSSNVIFSKSAIFTESESQFVRNNNQLLTQKLLINKCPKSTMERLKKKTQSSLNHSLGFTFSVYTRAWALQN